MSRDQSYKPQDSTIVTVPLDPALHKRLRVHAAEEGRTIKWIVTNLIEQHLDEMSRAALQSSEADNG